MRGRRRIAAPARQLAGVVFREPAMTIAALHAFPAAAPAAAAPRSTGDYVTDALARAVALRRHPGTDVDGALALFVRRARAEDQPMERMLLALRRVLAASLGAPADDDPAEVTALLLRRAITEYYR
jgi:hypothetical protein